MKQPINFFMFTVCLLTLTACGAYVGSPPKTEVHETTTTSQPPDEVHIYNTP
jgi:hypothetical protein